MATHSITRCLSPRSGYIQCESVHTFYCLVYRPTYELLWDSCQAGTCFDDNNHTRISGVLTRNQGSTGVLCAMQSGSRQSGYRGSHRCLYVSGTRGFSLNTDRHPPEEGSMGKETEGKTEFKYDVFISYSSEDKEWVRGELLTRIEQAGCSAKQGKTLAQAEL